MKYQYILFDLDGTLTDSALGITNSVMYALQKFGIYEENRESLYSFIGPPLWSSLSRVYGMTPEQANEAVVYFREYFSQKGIFENEPYAGIEKALETLQAMGKHLAVATSKPEEFARRILEHFDLAKYFEVIAGATMDKSRSKKADVIAYALKQLPGANPDNTMMVGDRENDVLGARENGLPCLGVLYGYGSSLELETAGAWKIAANMAELTEFLRI